MDPADIVADIINTFCSGKGFNLDGVQRGNFLVETIKFNYQQPSKALQSLAKLIGWDWFIGPDKSRLFLSRATWTTAMEAARSGTVAWPDHR